MDQAAEAHASPSSARVSPLVPKLRLNEVDRLKEEIKRSNNNLYKMQAQVLAATWDPTIPGQQEYLLDLTRRAAELEDHVSDLCLELKTARAITQGKMGMEEWQKTQKTTARAIEESLSTAHSKKYATTLAEEAEALEKEAEIMVRELRSKLSRGTYDEYTTATRVHSKELDELEAELVAAHSGAGTRTVQEILPKIKACQQDFARLQEMSESSTAEDMTEGSDDEDEGLAYEDVQSIAVGDQVQLICDDEDGFCRGDKALVVEYDPSIAYPYRVQKRGATGYFKACDITLIQRKRPLVLRTPCPLSPKSHAKASSSPHPNPYMDTPYGSESGEEDYEIDADLEKGKCRTIDSTVVSFMASAKDMAVTLNPLATI